MTKPEDSQVMERELAVVERALESGSSDAPDPGDRELAQMALDLAAQSPDPPPALRRELRGRVDAGFPRKHRLPSARLPGVPKLTRARLVPAFGVAASLVVAVVVAVSLSREDSATVESSSKAGRPGASGGEVQDSLRRAPREDFSRAASPPPARDQSAPDQGQRRVERSAQLTLAAPDDDMDKLGDDVTGVADRYGGFVLSSSLSTGQGSGGGTFDLRVRADDLRAALRDLSRLGSVRSRSQSGQDVTGRYVSLDDRLQTSRADRRGLLRRLERANTGPQAEALRRRIDLNAREISGLRIQLKALRASTDYARISVSVEDQSGSTGPAGSRDGLGGALDDALASLSGSVEILIRLLGVALPLAILGGLGWATARTLKRRRREAALT